MTTNFEPTLYDVIELIQAMETRLTETAQSNFRLLSSRIDNVDEQMADVKQTVTKLAFRIEDVYDEFLDFKNFASRMLKLHEKRITKLETRPA